MDGRSEFLGRLVEVTVASDPTNRVSGTVVDETLRTLVIRTNGDRLRIQKRGSRFHFPQEGVSIDGDRIGFRPEDRIKKVRER